MRVPLLDLTAQYHPLRDEILAAIARLAESQHFILGPEVEAFEREIAEQIEVEHAIGVSSGTDALVASLMALGVGAGAEVICPSYSFFATAGSISRLGATPVFVDNDPVSFNIDPDALAAAITPSTRAILPVHLFGLCADMPRVTAIASQAGVPMLEDAAQAIGARCGGRQAGAFGLAGAFSFFPSKNLGAFGDAGLVATNDASFAREVRLLRNHGMEPKYLHARVGGNFRLDALQAAILRVKAPHLQAWTDARRCNAARYASLFQEFRLDLVTRPTEPPDYRHIYNQYVIRGPRRDELRAHLAARDIGTEIYYPVPLHQQACFRPPSGGPPRLPHAEHAAASSLALPIFGELTEAQQRHVVSSIAEFYGTAQ